ncbi:MAG: hypothetical protein RTU30_13715, partial [Candidatus Thorarchaeota archaeon]
MRRILVPILLVTLLLAIATPTNYTAPQNNMPGIIDLYPDGQDSMLVSASGAGSSSQSIAYFSRVITNQDLNLSNSYSDATIHQNSTDLSSYLIPGWTLNRVEINANDMTALAEDVVLTTGTATNNFAITDYLPGIYQNELAQGFYNFPHDGRLHDYWVKYGTNTHLRPMSAYGTLNLEVREDYTNSSSVITTPVSMSEQAVLVWQKATADVNLTASTPYYTVMDGSGLSPVSGDYPDIYWQSSVGGGSYTTAWYDTGIPDWTTRPLEAYLNYTYTPWNMTTNSALHFKTPSSIGLKVNGSSISGGGYLEITSGTDMTSLMFNSTQSVLVDFNMTLWYERSYTTQNDWDIATSGGAVDWNSTLTVTYPNVVETSSRFLNISKMPDWGLVGLYNGTSTVDHGNNVTYANKVVYSSMTNGSWTMVSLGDNYISGITTLDSSDKSVLTTNVSVQVDVDIITLVEDLTGMNATSGDTYLTIWAGGTMVYEATPNETVTNGSTEYLWDVSVDTPDNVRYRIEVSWTNGTEAGYLTRNMIVWYPTTLTAQQASISAFSENTFEIFVDYNETFGNTGLDLTNGTVTCTLSGGYP